MQRLIRTALVAAIALSGCSSSEGSTANTVDPTVVDSSGTVAGMPVDTTASTVPEATIADSTTTASPSTGTVTEDDLVRFLAATESVLRGTALEDVVYDAPEIYIALAQSACARFTAGESFELISTDLVAAVASENADDDQRLVGAILGAATHTICPEHADLV